MKSILLLVALLAFATHPGVPDLSGRWVLDPAASTGTPPVPSALVIISQTADDVRFDFENRGETIASESFETNWQSSKRFSTRTQVGYARARWEKTQLLVETTVALNVEGTQSYSYSERWAVSPDRSTLTQISSDGTKLIFHRAPKQEESQP
jgi:hypothetical protein